MAEITRVIQEEIPDLRFIGKAYTSFRDWGDWWQNGWFDLLENTIDCDKMLLSWENAGGYIGLEKRREGELSAYYIGMFALKDTPVPEGFEAVDFCGVNLGTCWIYGKESDLHDTISCREKILEGGMAVWRDSDGFCWSFENCLCPRYTTPDSQGNVILDYCWFIEK